MYGRSLEGMFAAMLFVVALAGAAVMAFLVWVVPWLWGLVKPWLHTLTAT